MAQETSQQVVRDIGRWEWSEMWKKEDWWAIWLGFVILLAGILIYFPHAGSMQSKIEEAESKLKAQAERTTAFKTIAWYQLSDAKKKVKALDIPAGKWLKTFSGKPKKWTSNPGQAFIMNEDTAAGKKEKAVAKYEKAKAAEGEAFAKAEAAEKLAEEAGFQDAQLNESAKVAIADWRDAQLDASKAKKKTKAKAYNQIPYLIGLGIFFAIFFGVGMAAMGTPFGKFLKGFAFVFVIAVIAYIASSQATMKHYGIGYAAWAIFSGCSSAIPWARPNGPCRRYRPNITSKPAWCCWAPKFYLRK